MRDGWNSHSLRKTLTFLRFVDLLYEHVQFAPLEADCGTLPGGLDFQEFAEALHRFTEGEEESKEVMDLVETDEELLQSITKYIEKLMRVATRKREGPSTN